MAAVPAPGSFANLRDFLHEHRIDAEYLRHILQQYLNAPDTTPITDMLSEPLVEHQAWAYRETLRDFCELIEPGPDDGDEIDFYL